MNTPQILVNWRKSSRSGGSGGNCVQVCVIAAEVSNDDQLA
ncbi:DUF397 domain-containing protein [Actinoallomurus acanthiterrae]